MLLDRHRRPKARIRQALVDPSGRGILIGDIAGLMSVDGIGTSHQRHYEGRLRPDIPFAYALEIDVQVETFPVSAETEAVLIARLGVSNHLEIPVIVFRPGSAVNLTVSVNIFELMSPGP